MSTERQTPVLLWDVDTQVDFMLEDGKLYVPGSEEILPNLERITEAARRLRLPVVASADDHEESDDEISHQPDFEHTYPPHCMRGTPGVRRVEATAREWTFEVGHDELPTPQLELYLRAAEPPVVLIRKKSVDVFDNPNTERIVGLLDPQQVVVFGVALDICDRYAIEGLLARGYSVTLVADAAKALDEARAEALIADWRQRGVRMVTTRELLGELDARAS